MVANIAERGGAQYRIGQRVERNIGIAMSGKAIFMRDADAAQPQFFAPDEAMDIIAGTGADIVHARRLAQLAVKVTGKGEFGQIFIAFDNSYLMPSSHHHPGIVGGDLIGLPVTMRL